MSDELLWCPSGYIPLHKLPKMALSWTRNGMADPAIESVFDGPAFMSEIIGEPLARGGLRTVGVSVISGKLLTIPPSAWRHLHRNDPYETTFSYPIQAALAGYEIWVGDESEQEFCHVVVALCDLADWLNAKPVPPEPRERPADWPEQQPAPPKPSSPRSRRNAGGAPPKHQWDDFWTEVIRYTAAGSIDPGERIKLQKHMEVWSADEWPEPPDASTIRKRLACLYEKSGCTSSSAEQRSSGRSSSRHNWHAFWIEAAHYAAANGLGDHLKLEKHMEEWVAQEWYDPDASAVRKRLSHLYVTSMSG